MIRGPDAARTGAAGTTLPKATSVALQRLEGRQVITLRIDADAPILDSRPWPVGTPGQSCR